MAAPEEVPEAAGFDAPPCGPFEDFVRELLGEAARHLALEHERRLAEAEAAGEVEPVASLESLASAPCAEKSAPASGPNSFSHRSSDESKCEAAEQPRASAACAEKTTPATRALALPHRSAKAPRCEAAEDGEHHLAIIAGKPASAAARRHNFFHSASKDSKKFEAADDGDHALAAQVPATVAEKPAVAVGRRHPLLHSVSTDSKLEASEDGDYQIAAQVPATVSERPAGRRPFLHSLSKESKTSAFEDGEGQLAAQVPTTFGEKPAMATARLRALSRRSSKESKFEEADDGNHPLAVPVRDGCAPALGQAAPLLEEAPELPGPELPAARGSCVRNSGRISGKTLSMPAARRFDHVVPGAASGEHSEDGMSSFSRRSQRISQHDVGELKFGVLPVWSQAVPPVRSRIASVKTIRSHNHLMLPPKPRAVSGRWRVMSPNSFLRFAWDLLSIACILHDAAVAPLEFLEAPSTGLLLYLGWFARVFWPLDIVATFLTGIQLSDGTMELRPTAVARHYVFRWFVPDMILVVADWMEVFLDEANKASKLVGLLRSLRLARLIRLQRIMRVTVEKTMSEKMALLLSVINSVGAIVGIAHALASIWLGLGRAGQGSWVSVLGLPEDEHFEQYIVALHWSLTNFAGTMELYPQTPTERCFAIASLMLGFIIASWFVSSITSSMTRLSMITSKHARQFAVLNKFMKEHGISGGLARRVQLNAKHAIEEQEEHMQEANVELLMLVSEPLRAEVHLEIYSPNLLCHPLFQRLNAACPRTMQQLCHLAVSVSALEERDFVFTRGEMPDEPKMLFILSGIFEYTQDGEHIESVTAGQWVGEQVLWTDWVYHGNLQATNACHLLLVDAHVFWRLCGPGQLGGGLEVSKYAAKFVQWQNSSPEVRTDIGDDEDCQRLIREAYGPELRRSMRYSVSRMFGRASGGSGGLDGPF